jgi:hypothetical protein
VRYKELGVLLPLLSRKRIEVQLVTSAVRPIPAEWAGIPDLHLVVSIDGMQPEHDRRRAPATYDRILKHIAGHRFIVHCTITRQMLRRADDIREFARFWSAQPEIYKVWYSLYTPQEGDDSEERLRPQDRERIVRELAEVRQEFPKVYMPDAVLNGYLTPPDSPGDCIFARVTQCYTADLKTHIGPCQFGGRPVCSECGCMASAGMASVGAYRLAGILPVREIFKASSRLGETRLLRASAAQSMP